MRTRSTRALAVVAVALLGMAAVACGRNDTNTQNTLYQTAGIMPAI